MPLTSVLRCFLPTASQPLRPPPLGECQPELSRVPLLKGDDAPLVIGIASGPVTRGEDAGLIVLGDHLVLLGGLIPAPDHFRHIDFGRPAVHQPIKIHVGMQGVARREQLL